MSGAATPVETAAWRALRGLDGLLFEPREWFAIDDGNNRVPDVAPRSLTAALALVGQGRVATVVGRLRSGVTGIDIDVKGAAGVAIAERLSTWCTTKGLWHLVRPSGRATGHAHVLVLAGVHVSDLQELLAQLRNERGLSGKTLDQRTQLRPLSAPHRVSGLIADVPHAAEKLHELRGILDLFPSTSRDWRPRTTARTEISARGRQVADGVLPAVPLPRRRSDLPAEVAAYLEQGRAAAGSLDADPSDRSLIEAKSTKYLVIAGLEEHEAWAAIAGSHPTAFPKAKAAGRPWWRRYVWNPAVDADTTWRMEHLPTQTAGALQNADEPGAQRARAAITYAIAVVEASWRSWPRETRHVDRDVALTVLDRLYRAGALEQMIPQRDLLQDCAVADRRTAVAALRRCVARELFQEISDTYLPGTSDTSHTIRLTVYEDDVEDLQGGAMSLNVPPRSSRTQAAALPYRRLPTHLRRALRRPALAALAEHLPPGGSAGLSVETLARRAGYLEHPDDELTTGQRRTVLGHLRHLAEEGLAVVDGAGHWAAANMSASTDLADRGRRAQLEIQLQVATERHDHREFLDPARRTAHWKAQEAAAIARSRKADLARQKAYVAGLPADELATLRQEGRRAYERMSIEERAAFQHRQASRRALGGVSEQEHHDAWVERQDPAELERRSLERASRFARLAPPQRQAEVMMWQDHRSTWNVRQTASLRRQTFSPPAVPLPHIELHHQVSTPLFQVEGGQLAPF